MWTVVIAVLSRQTDAGDGRLWVLASGPSPGGARTNIAAAVVGVHPGEDVLRARHPPLVEAVVAGHGSAPTAHLDEGVALGVVACHGRGSTPSESLRYDLLLQRGGGRG